MSKRILCVATLMLAVCAGLLGQERNRNGNNGPPREVPSTTSDVLIDPDGPLIAMGPATKPGEPGKAPLSDRGGAKAVTFFGQESPKRGVIKVLFLVDKSGSMNTLFDYVKIGLQRSIKELNPRHEFQIIMFADGPPDELKIDGDVGLHHGTEKNKKAAFDWIKKKWAMSENGQTSPVDSFKRAFSIQPNLPQLIYVLTDGGFEDKVLDYLRVANKDKKVIINTIGFASREGEEVLKKMAKENGGTYKYLSEEALKKYGGQDEDQSGPGIGPGTP